VVAAWYASVSWGSTSSVLRKGGGAPPSPASARDAAPLAWSRGSRHTERLPVSANAM